MQKGTDAFTGLLFAEAHGSCRNYTCSIRKWTRELGNALPSQSPQNTGSVHTWAHTLGTGMGSTGLIRKMRFLRLSSGLKQLFSCLSWGFPPLPASVAHTTFMSSIPTWKCKVKLQVPSDLWNFARETWVLIDSRKTLNNTLSLLITSLKK